MNFNSPEFLYIFLPLFLIIYSLSKDSHKKWILLFASIGIYAWFQKSNAIVVGIVVCVNYFFLVLISKWKDRKISGVLLIIALVLNIGTLLFFKLFSSSNWLQTWILLNIPSSIIFKDLSYPLGFSFISFQIMACLFDMNNSQTGRTISFWNYLNYLMMFPKILLGPISRFDNIESQLTSLSTSNNQRADGIKRFIIGLAKKVLIADQLAIYVNKGFELSLPAYPTRIAWVLLLAYTIQIYYDFSGVIDMALGLGKMLGITLPENFNQPYLSLNITEFWRRWHMTLTSWFREYVFYPLEYKYRKIKRLRQEVNIVIVFFLTGLWHGFSVHYLIWGLLQGLLLILEKSGIGKFLKKLPKFLQSAYFIFVIMMSWVIFRSPSVTFAFAFYKKLFHVNQGLNPYTLPFIATNPLPIFNNSFIIALILGILFLLPMKNIWRRINQNNIQENVGVKILVDVVYILLMVITLFVFASQKFTPAIYANL